MPRRAKPGVNWAEIEKAIRAGQSSTSLAKQHGVARQSIDKKANKQGWRDGPQKWMPAIQQTETVRRLESPESSADKAIITQGNRTPETAAAILWSLESGVGMTQAALSNGISYETLLAWRKSDQVFDRLIWQARHAMLGEMQGHIVGAARRGDWKAAETVLKSAPETRKDYAQTGVGAGGISVNISIRGADHTGQSGPPEVEITQDPPSEAVSEQDETLQVIDVPDSSSE